MARRPHPTTSSGDLQIIHISYIGPWTWSYDTSSFLKPKSISITILVTPTWLLANSELWLETWVLSTWWSDCSVMLRKCKDQTNIGFNATKRFVHYSTRRDHQPSFGQSAQLTLTGLSYTTLWYTPPGTQPTHQMRVQAVISNPHITDWYFSSKLSDWIDHWLYKTLDAEWHWFQYEIPGSW